jgi:four helix bundle protein
MGQGVKSFRELEVYQLAFAFQQEVFRRSKQWPKEEMYALTDQARRCTRSVGAALAEAWGKRRYSAHFLSKLTDADAENQESQHWIDTATACGYITETEAEEWISQSESIGRLLGSMMSKHESFCFKTPKTENR